MQISLQWQILKLSSEYTCKFICRKINRHFTVIINKQEIIIPTTSGKFLDFQKGNLTSMIDAL